MEKDLARPEYVPPSLQIRVRCPECLKLFSVAAGSIRASKPQFQCNSCRTPFWMSYPECLAHSENIGFPMDWLKDDIEAAAPAPQKPKVDVPAKFEPPPEETAKPSIPEDRVSPEPGFPASKVHEIQPPQVEARVLERLERTCPKCGEANENRASECNACGVIFAKFELQNRDPRWLTANSELKHLWVKVLDDYENHEVHREFIRKCKQLHDMDFAASRYGRILEGNPSDDIARKYIDELIIRASLPTETGRTANDKEKNFRVPFTSIILVLCGIVMMTGYLVPELRNLVGIGASSLFLTLAIRFYFK